MARPPGWSREQWREFKREQGRKDKSAILKFNNIRTGLEPEPGSPEAERIKRVRADNAKLMDSSRRAPAAPTVKPDVPASPAGGASTMGYLDDAANALDQAANQVHQETLPLIASVVELAQRPAVRLSAALENARQALQLALSIGSYQTGEMEQNFSAVSHAAEEAEQHLRAAIDASSRMAVNAGQLAESFTTAATKIRHSGS